MKRKFISVIIALSMLCSFMPCIATAATVSGESYEDVTWTLDGDTMTISGTGDVWWNLSSDWEEYIDDIKNIIIGEGITSISFIGFCDHPNLETISVPASVTKIQDMPVEGCTSLTEINVSSDNTVYSSVDGVLYDKSGTKLLQYPAGKTASSYTVSENVTAIENNAFYEVKKLTSITLPESVAELDAPFSGCTAIRKIEVESGNEHFISDGGIVFNSDKTEIVAYPSARSSTSYQIPESVTKIGNGAFDSSQYLKSIEIPETVTVIGNRAFYDCTKLKGVVLPETIEEVGSGAFRNCTAITELALPKGLKKLGGSAFSGCTALKSMTIPDGITEIGSSTFDNCTSLESVVLPDGITEIHWNAFENCTSLKNVDLPDTVNVIEEYAFYNCTALESIEIPYGVTKIESETFYNCKSLKEVKIPGSVTSIWEYAFYKCNALESLTIPEGVETLEYCSFARCTDLLKIRLPNSLKTYDGAFDGVYPDDVYYNGTEKEWESLTERSYDTRLSTYATVHYEPKPIITDGTHVRIGNNTYTAQVPLKNVLVDSYLIAALYDDGALVKMESRPLSLETTSEEISLEAENADTMKVFVWDSLSGAQPMCKSYSVDIVQ